MHPGNTIVSILGFAAMAIATPPSPPFHAGYLEVGPSDHFADETTLDEHGNCVSLFRDQAGQRVEITSKEGRTTVKDLPSFTSPNAPVKYCQGRCYAQNGRKVFRYDASNRAWRLVFEAPRTFSQFEVLDGGRILLLGTLSGKGPGKGAFGNGPDAKDLRMGSLLEVWRPGAAQPECRFAYDGETTQLARMVNDLPNFDKLWALGQDVFIYSTYTGRLGRYDQRTGRLAWVKTPWTGLTPRVLTEWERDFGKALPRTGNRNLEFIDSPHGRIQPCVQGGQVWFLYHQRVAPPGWEATYLAMLQDPKRSSVCLPVPGDDNPAGYLLVSARFLPAEARLAVEERRDPRSLKGFIRIEGNGRMGTR